MLGDEVVISGIGANFPHSLNVQDFGNDLLNNKNLATPTNRWKYDHELEVNPVCGQVPFESFDQVFYGINKSLATNTDPVSKMGYQRSFEAVLDAGLHPYLMRGADVAVFVGSGVNELEQRMIYTKAAMKYEGYTVMGTARTMFANRISYFFDFKGPSLAMDASYGSAHLQLQLAAERIRNGESNAALIVASNLTRFPESSVLLKGLGIVTGDGITRSFDHDASGAIRSDSVVAFFLQRASEAKRCYARILASSLEFVGSGSTVDFTLPNPSGIQSFITNLYRSHSIDPTQLVYVEADGSAHPIRDECELNAIDAALVKGTGRSGPLFIGSVKSNLGHTDCVSGYAAICKAIVAMETGIIPATVNLRNLNERVEALVDGRLRVVDTNTPLQLTADSLLAVNTLGLAGTVGHTVLQANPRERPPPQEPGEHLPRLVTVSGRTEEGVREVVKKIQAAPFDTNYYRLVQDTFSQNIRGYNYRSYIICPAPEEYVAPVVSIEKRTVWFVYSGMGSQWAGMGTGLMSIPLFADTIERLHAVLETRGVDLKSIITETGPEAFDNILKSFVGITACQIALTNVLTALGVVPNGILGHSVGEVACAYLDGCLTEEQAILTAWARGVASNEAKLIKGMMAAIGLGYKDVLPRLPPTIDVACHNSDSSCTLSGPAEDVEQFVQQLSDEGVFARAVNVSDIAYHSRYIQPAAPFLRSQLEKVITDPKPRSSKWITTSVPVDKRETDLGQFCSVEYQTNNLLSPVLFEEALQSVPSSSMLIEVAPHGLLQAILKRALPDNFHVAMTQRGNSDPIRYLLDAVGKISLGSASPDVAALYPPVEFPVPRGVGSLATLVTWQTGDSEFRFMEGQERVAGDLQLHNDSPFLKVNSTRVLPLSELLSLLWARAAQSAGSAVGSSAIDFGSIRVESWKPIPSEGVANVQTGFLSGMSNAEIMDESQRLVVRGRATAIVDDLPPTQVLPELKKDGKNMVTLSKDEFYRSLETFGLQYYSIHQNIKSIRISDEDWFVTVAFSGDWSALFESLLQVFLLRDMDDAQELQLPRSIQRLVIDPSKIKKQSDILLRLNLASGAMVGNGVCMSGFQSTPCPRELQSDNAPRTLEHLSFGPTKFQTLNEFLRSALSTVIDKASTKADITVLGFRNGRKTTELTQALATFIRTVTGTPSRVVTVVADGAVPLGLEGPVPLLVSGPDTLPQAALSLASGLASALLVWSGTRLSSRKEWPVSAGTAIVAEQRFGDDWISLVRRATVLTPANTLVVHVGASTPTVVPEKPSSTIVLVWRGLDEAQVEAAIAEADSRPYASNARMVFISDDTAPPFSLTDPLYADQLARGSRVNVLVQGSWGCWKTMPLPMPPGAALTASSLDNVQLKFVSVNPLRRGTLSGHVDYVGVDKAGRGSPVMGIGRWLADYRRPELDPLLRWPVPQEWSAEEAATVPYVYSAAYYSLKVQAKARPGESILVHEGTSAIGQAAIRVANQLGCSPIFATVKDGKEADLLGKMFPQLEPRHVLQRGEGGSFEFRLRQLTHGRGANIVFNTLGGSELVASIRCVALMGCILHHCREDMEAARTIGTHDFLRSIALYGFSGHELFRTSARDRTEVAESMSRGIRDGVVQPIVGAKVYNAIHSAGGLESCTKAVVAINSSSPAASQQCDPNKCYLVIGRETDDALLVASRLAMLGARHLLAAVGASGNIATVRQRALQRRYGATLHVKQVAVWDAASMKDVVKAAASVAPVHTAVAIAKDDSDVGVLALLASALLPSAGLVLLADRVSSTFQLASLTAQRNARNAEGRRTVSITAPLSSAVDLLADILGGVLPAVCVLPANSTTMGGESRSDAFLQLTPSTLSVVGRGASRSASGPSFLRIPSLGLPLHCTRDNQPLYALPPLGVLEDASRDQIAGLAARLFNPVFVVETSAQLDVRDTAKAVVEAVLARQPFGPYNVLGWHLGSVLALEVQRQLESRGKRGKLFLLYGDVTAARQWAGECPAALRVAEALGPANKVESEHGRRGVEVVTRLLDAIARHESDVKSPFQGQVHVARTSVDDEQSMDVADPNVQVKTFTDPNLDHPPLISYMNDNTAYSQLAGYDDLRQSVLRPC